MEKWKNGIMGKWENGIMEKWENGQLCTSSPLTFPIVHFTSFSSLFFSKYTICNRLHSFFKKPFIQQMKFIY